MSDIEKHWRYFQDCLSETPPVAEMKLIEHAQTAVMLNHIFAHDNPVTLDYGCGRLRLLHALLLKKSDRGWEYVRVDIVETNDANPDF